MAAGDPILAADYLGIRRATIDNSLVRIRQVAAQSIPTGVTTAILMDTEDFDPFALHSTVSNTSRITPNLAGYWEFSGSVFLGATTAGAVDAAIFKNTTTQIQSGTRMGFNAQAQGLPARAIVYMNGTTDFVDLQVTHASAAAVNTNVSLRLASFLEGRFLGRVTNP